MAGLFQIASLSHPLGPGLPDHDAYQVVGRAPVQVDRIQARLTVEPKPDGTVPPDELIRALERAIKFKLSLDRNESRMLTVGEIPVCAVQQLQGGPLPVQPFKLAAGEECKIQVKIHPNLYKATIFTEYPGAHLEILFYGVEL
jgi:hypothetical protein